MSHLHKQFEDVIALMGISTHDFPIALFYNAPVGIRFEIGESKNMFFPGTRRINPAYRNNALIRAKTLFDDLPYSPNILRIDIYPQEKSTFKRDILRVISKIGLLPPHETITQRRFDEHSSYIQEHLYWDLSTSTYQADKLLLEIINGDLDGYSELCGSTYFLNTECPILYYLYDDRGADVIAKDKSCLRPLYQKYSSWILEYDRERIDRIFAE